ncbi:hydroxypyruvate isomerase [Glaciimonas immobilis]|uniref:Hydroxypyruvate isomerase n=1 Tax=Glaciimonas immobilis TaxID=728004 RepID=A0A840RRW5_9BURK|nr:hydroxypyruvate isomerase [Glaciimonas immobilis]KAF3997747.1 hydroxypyruvate isomerase [Glaciimonas immobilis]MBB5200525.1 hydroxypyruvate isomerase [Glaciimonas immobilis]
MTKLAANLTMLFTELPFLDRFGAAAKAGFKGVEFLFPYGFRPEEINDKLQTNNLELVLHNLPAGNWEGGERGIACHPNRVSEFNEGVEEALRYAKVFGLKQVNCLVGIAPAGVSAEELKSTVVSNLKFAADRLQTAGIRLLIEPINTFDIPGFYLNGTHQALDLIKATGSNNIFIQYDIYHMQRMEGELAATIKANLASIKHVQLADNPGRFEPGTGEINYRFLFQFLDELGYEGWIGCEYKPKAGTSEGLGWRKDHGL